MILQASDDGSVYGNENRTSRNSRRDHQGNDPFVRCELARARKESGKLRISESRRNHSYRVKRDSSGAYLNPYLIACVQLKTAVPPSARDSRHKANRKYKTAQGTARMSDASVCAIPCRNPLGTCRFKRRRGDSYIRGIVGGNGIFGGVRLFRRHLFKDAFAVKAVQLSRRIQSVILRILRVHLGKGAVLDVKRRSRIIGGCGGLCRALVVGVQMRKSFVGALNNGVEVIARHAGSRRIVHFRQSVKEYVRVIGVPEGVVYRGVGHNSAGVVVNGVELRRQAFKRGVVPRRGRGPSCRLVHCRINNIGGGRE